MTRLRAMSEEDKEVVGFRFVNDIVEELEGFLVTDEKDADARTLKDQANHRNRQRC